MATNPCIIIRNPETKKIERVNAPNGEESKLFNDIVSLGIDKETALKHWGQVYTDSFKNWFGDWERKQGSKVVDKNGEPLLVYHNTMIKQNEFKGYVTYFTDNKEYAETFKGLATGELQYTTFLNIKNPENITHSELANVPEEVHMTDKYTNPAIIKLSLIHI